MVGYPNWSGTFQFKSQAAIYSSICQPYKTDPHRHDLSKDINAWSSINCSSSYKIAVSRKALFFRIFSKFRLGRTAIQDQSFTGHHAYGQLVNYFVRDYGSGLVMPEREFFALRDASSITTQCHASFRRSEMSCFLNVQDIRCHH